MSAPPLASPDSSQCALLRGWRGLASLGIREEEAHVGMRRDNACDVFSFFCEAGGEAIS